MSYILDALKKADRDRRQARVPSLATIHAVPDERRNVWPWVIAGALALNVAAFGGFVMLRESPAPPPPAPVSVAPRPVTTTADAPAPPAVTAKRVEAVATAAAPAAAAPARTPVPRDETPAREPDVLKLEVLIYSSNPAERVAYINGQRYVEGQRVNARFTVERITSDSVVLAGKDARQILKQQ
ncbi:MAG: general secretion pathway protein GspB [Candidatus Rokubacteria bacterium]|nr:general secretion pathway protein GspB [Candidatus Rokubacteria bacterium]